MFKEIYSKGARARVKVIHGKLEEARLVGTSLLLQLFISLAFIASCTVARCQNGLLTLVITGIAFPNATRCLALIAGCAIADYSFRVCLPMVDQAVTYHHEVASIPLGEVNRESCSVSA